MLYFHVQDTWRWMLFSTKRLTYQLFKSMIKLQERLLQNKDWETRKMQKLAIFFFQRSSYLFKYYTKRILHRVVITLTRRMTLICEVFHRFTTATESISIYEILISEAFLYPSACHHFEFFLSMTRQFKSKIIATRSRNSLLQSTIRDLNNNIRVSSINATIELISSWIQREYKYAKSSRLRSILYCEIRNTKCRFICACISRSHMYEIRTDQITDAWFIKKWLKFDHQVWIHTLSWFFL